MTLNISAHRMSRKARAASALAIGLSLTLSLGAWRPALPPQYSLPGATPAQFTVAKIGDQPGAAFLAIGDLVRGNQSQEILDTVLNFDPDPLLGIVPRPSPVKLYTNVSGTWTPSTVVSESEGILNPNQPQIADVNGDGRQDFILPAGWFFNSVNGIDTGSITWWENLGNGTFKRHNIITGAHGAYEGVAYTDFNGDGIKDIVTTLEDYGNPFFPPFVPQKNTVQFFEGTGNGGFKAPVNLCDCGGPLVTGFDVNRDGKLDITVAQFLTVGGAPDPANGISDESFIWLENTAKRGQPLSAGTFSKHVIARGLGASFALYPVDNLDGNGKYGFIGVNHVNPAYDVPPVPAQVVKLTPGPDVRAPWNVSVVANNFPIDNAYPGQAAPGSTGEGDLNGDGTVDLAVGGDAYRSISWIERQSNGSWLQHNLNNETGNAGADWGQSGVKVADLNYDGKNEIIFSSYDAGGVFIASRNAGTGGKVPAFPHLPDAQLPYSPS